MARISYYPFEDLEDADLRHILEHAATYGTPRPETQAIRAHAPATLRDFWWQWERTFRNGVCDHAIKELCRVYVSKTVECLYCGSQRSTKGREAGLAERDYDALLEFESSDRYDERQRAALAYTRAIAWNPDEADEAMWEQLRLHFSDEEIIELGYFVAVTFGQQSWIRTMDVGHREYLAESDAGLAPSEVPTEASR
jgi:alkylhydroperoxidase family enzyme